MGKTVTLPRCQCGQVGTTAKLSKCRPCTKCGKTLHSQYDLLYHESATDGQACSEI
jgi:hypothetical protein